MRISRMHFSRFEKKQLRARLLRMRRAAEGIIPQTGSATEENEHLDVDSDSDDGWSSDEDVGYSES